jgi:glycosyltransferase involved in cell wall biosynthesis
MARLTLGVIIPCYNEEATILKIIPRVLEQEQVKQVVVIDDCSTDNSAALIKSLDDSRILYFKNTENVGKGSSIAKGIELISTDAVLIQDADLEYSPDEYPLLMNAINEGRGDVVFGSRFFSHGERRALYYRHRLGNKLLTTLSNIFTNLDITDMETCYKVMLTKYAKVLYLEENRFGIEPEITAKIAAMQLRVFEVPISYTGRSYEEGKKITWKDGVSALRCIVKYNTPMYKRNYLKKVNSALSVIR